MNVNPLSTNIVNLLIDEPVKRGAASEELGGSFADILTEAFENTVSTDLADKVSAVELLAGQTDDMSGLLLDAQKAEIALSLALQIRSKVLDAYNEVMRMSL